MVRKFSKYFYEFQYWLTKDDGSEYQQIELFMESKEIPKSGELPTFKKPIQLKINKKKHYNLQPKKVLFPITEQIFEKFEKT